MTDVKHSILSSKNSELYQPARFAQSSLGARSGLYGGCIKTPNQAPRVSVESLQACVAWRCPDGTQHLFCWPIQDFSGQSLASNDSVVDSRDLNSVFGHAAATPNK
ncbi:hypothetical protein TNCV_4351041 [Trichonephila clavipes]|nr:hypothetical protein TNCV_4351041 [Trichonephila clavipes]